MADSITIIKDAESLFTGRTGLTLLIPKNDFFDRAEGEEVVFSKSDKSEKQIILYKKDAKAIVENINPQHIASSIEKNFIMFYETNKKGQVVRNNLCKYSAK